LFFYEAKASKGKKNGDILENSGKPLLKRMYFTDGMTSFKTAMNNYQSFLQTNTKTDKNFKKGF
jgi:Tfp pilus assembly protein PilF